MHAGYPVVVALLTFAASLAYSNYLVQRVNERALTISQDSVPRLEYISLTRRELLETTTLADEYIARTVSGKKKAREQIAASRARLHADVAAYRSLPLSAAEVQPLRTIWNDITLLDTSLERALDEADSGAPQHALRRMTGSAEVLMLDTDQMLERLRSLNEERIRRHAEHILGMRRRAVEVAAALGLLSFGAALGAVVVVLRAQRSRARLATQRDRVLTERATELESFAGRVAHDLRDPLNAVGLRLAAILHGGDLDQQLRSNLEKAGRQLERMRSVIDGLLEFARSGANPPLDARADLAVILDEVIASLRPAADAARAELRVDAFPHMLLAVAPEALTSVLSNLVGNAVKYVGEGQQLPHRVAVRVIQLPGFARIEVEDNGPGLPRGAELRIFEPFRRLASKQPGTGLGLATVKRIVEAYQGQVGVNSELGRGSTFWVELPSSEMHVTARTESSGTGPTA